MLYESTTPYSDAELERTSAGNSTRPTSVNTTESTVTRDSELQEPTDRESVRPAYGEKPPEFLSEIDLSRIGKPIIELTPERAILEGASIVAQGNIVSIDAGGLGHTPDGRGRSTGPNDRYWRDYCNTIRGHICYGPYHNLGPGVYRYYYDIKFQIPVCGNANDAVVFEFDSTRNVGQPIPGSNVYVLRWKFMCERADEDNVFEGQWGGSFAIADPTNEVEMRLKNRITSIAGLPFELLVRRLLYWKE